MNPAYIQLIFLVLTSGASLGAHIWVIRWGRRTKKIEEAQPEAISAAWLKLAVLESQVQDLRQDMHDTQKHVGDLRETAQRILSRINGTGWKRES